MIERGKEDKELPALKPILRWKKGQKIAQRNQVRFGLHYFPRRPVALSDPELTAEAIAKLWVICTVPTIADVSASP